MNGPDIHVSAPSPKTYERIVSLRFAEDLMVRVLPEAIGMEIVDLAVKELIAQGAVKDIMALIDKKKIAERIEDAFVARITEIMANADFSRHRP